MYTCLRQGNDFYVVLNYGKLQRIHSTGGMPIFHLPPFKCAHLYQICIQHTQMSKMYGIFQCSFYYNKNYYDRTQFYFKIKYKYKFKKLFLRLICFFHLQITFQPYHIVIRHFPSRQDQRNLNYCTIQHINTSTAFACY